MMSAKEDADQIDKHTVDAAVGLWFLSAVVVGSLLWSWLYGEPGLFSTYLQSWGAAVAFVAGVGLLMIPPFLWRFRAGRKRRLSEASAGVPSSGRQVSVK